MVKKNGISFVVTVFNKEKFILATLESLKKNIINNSEIIIIDDGSKDNSVEIIKNFIKLNPQIKVRFISQKNTGPSIAVNNAVKYVEFSHIKMVDGDDILSPNISNFMKSRMEFLNLDLLYGDWVWDEHHFKYKFIDSNQKTYHFKDAFKKFLLSGWGGFSNLMIKTDVFNKVNGCDEKVFIQDFSLPLRVSGYHLKDKTFRPFRVGITKKIICVGPKFIEERIITNNAQTLHDLSVASLNFIDEHPFINKSDTIKVLKKIIRRCWNWQKKKTSKKIFGLNIFKLLFSYFGIIPNRKKIKYYVLNVWKNEKNIKIKSYENQEKKILVYVGLDLLGDALIKIPFLQHLKKIFPQAKITWFAGKGKSAMKQDLHEIISPYIDKVIDNGDFGSKVIELFKKPKICGNFDIIFDTQKRFLTTLILKKIKTKVFISPSCDYFFSDLKFNLINEKNLAKELIGLSLLFNENKKLEIQSIKLPDKYNRLTTDFLKNSKKKVAICPGASNTWKRWPIENFINISQYLSSLNYLPVFFLGPNERNFHDLLKKSVPNAFFPLQNKKITKLNPLHTISFARHCSFGISNDTGCGHLLATANIDMITLFGPTNYIKFAPYLINKKNIIISAANFSKENKIDNIPIQSVHNAIKELIA